VDNYQARIYVAGEAAALKHRFTFDQESACDHWPVKPLICPPLTAEQQRIGLNRHQLGIVPNSCSKARSAMLRGLVVRARLSGLSGEPGLRASSRSALSCP